jgi:hypothetical protein
MRGRRLDRGLRSSSGHLQGERVVPWGSMSIQHHTVLQGPDRTPASIADRGWHPVHNHQYAPIPPHVRRSLTATAESNRLMHTYVIQSDTDGPQGLRPHYLWPAAQHAAGSPARCDLSLTQSRPDSGLVLHRCKSKTVERSRARGPVVPPRVPVFRTRQQSRIFFPI